MPGAMGTGSTPDGESGGRGGAAAPTVGQPGLGARLQDSAVRAAIAAALALPYRTRVRLFGATTERVLAPATKLGRRIEQNLDFIYPDLPRKRRQDIARGSANATGRLMIELYSWRDLARDMEEIQPNGPGWAAFEAAHRRGQPVLLMTGHFGNYLAARACLIARGYPIGGFYRPMANPYFNRHYVASMAASGGPVFPDSAGGTKGLIRFLRGGNAAMLLNDLYIGTGIELPFLGQPAMTSTAPAEIAKRTGAAMIPIWGIRQPDGLSFEVELDAPLATDDPVAATREYNAAVEARVRAAPEQWFWMHRRWKRKWRGGKGMEGDPHPAQLPSRRARV
ncbi:MAG: lysophospholipid acyltransferase family protein [Pseudomonadota bacterium]